MPSTQAQEHMTNDSNNSDYNTDSVNNNNNDVLDSNNSNTSQNMGSDSVILDSKKMTTNPNENEGMGMNVEEERHSEGGITLSTEMTQDSGGDLQFQLKHDDDVIPQPLKLQESLLSQSLHPQAQSQSQPGQFPPRPSLHRSGPPLIRPMELLTPRPDTSSTFVEITEDELGPLREIGRGVVSATYLTSRQGTAVVIKKPSLQPLGQAVGHLPGEEAQLMRREIELVRGLGEHPNVCKVIGACTHPSNMFVCYEYLSGGTLTALLRDESRRIDAGRIVLDIAEGMQFLHRCNILHRDLKSSNVLLDGLGRCKIADFGLSCSISSALTVDLTAETGTYRWMAPEIIRHEKYSWPADVYSFGIVLWEVIARKQPYADMTPIQAAFGVAKDHLRPTIPESCPMRAAGLMRSCWHPNKNARPPFSEIVPIVPQIRWNETQKS